MRYGDKHSRFVARAKLLLPLAALALLSTLFLFSGRPETAEPLPYAQAHIDELARTPQLTAPEYSGVTADGSALTMRSNTIQQKPNASVEQVGAEQMQADRVEAELVATDGLQTQMQAKSGQFDQSGKTMALEGEVTMNTSSGFSLQTEQLQAEGESGILTAPQPVQGAAPFGTLEAGAMQSTPSPEGTVLHFTGGVKLVYDPAK